jgi:hypothetical protein
VNFGSVVTNGTVARLVTLVNNGTAPAQVSALDITGAGFTLGAAAPAVPFTVAAGANVDVAVNYQPGAVGSSSGSLAVVSDDPANPSLTVTLSGAGIGGGDVVDMDITEFQATEKVELGGGSSGKGGDKGGDKGKASVELKLKVANRSKSNAQRTATVTGVQNGVEVYNVSQSVSAKGTGGGKGGKGDKGGSVDVTFPAYSPIAGGTIQWTATVQDEDPDSDIATRTTQVTVPPPVVLDLDINEFQVPGKIDLGKGKIDLKLKIVSRSKAEGQRTVTVTGAQNGAEVYRVSQLVSARGGNADVKQLPSYTPTAAGLIQWTATVEDDDPDVDTATGSTLVSIPPKKGGDDGKKKN